MVDRPFAMVAGETSGDLLAGLLLDGLKARWPALADAGHWWPCHAGPRLRELVAAGEAGCAGLHRSVAPLPWKSLAFDASSSKRLIEQPPALFVGIDAPDFNLGLEAGLREQGIKTVHFICPSIWAWRANRIEKIRAAADHVLCIFPFEPDLLAQHGIAASYVGHPLANVIPMEPDRRCALAESWVWTTRTRWWRCCLAAGLPKSPTSGSGFFDAAALLLKERPGMRFVLPAVPAQRERLVAMAQASGLGASIQVLAGQSHAALAACDVTLIASGTATLEAALFKRPMVIAYNMHPLSWRMMKRKQLQPWVGLPNILSGEFVVPELLQDAATPQALAQVRARMAGFS